MSVFETYLTKTNHELTKNYLLTILKLYDLIFTAAQTKIFLMALMLSRIFLGVYHSGSLL